MISPSTRRAHWWSVAFVTMATLVLLLTALAKVLTLTGSAKQLATPDPVFGVFSVRQLLALGAVLEIAVASIGFSRVPMRLKCGALAWVSSLFLFYRFGRWWLGVHEPCGCLGGIWQWLSLSRSTIDFADSALFVFLVFVWTGSCVCALNQPAPARFQLGKPCSFVP